MDEISLYIIGGGLCGAAVCFLMDYELIALHRAYDKYQYKNPEGKSLWKILNEEKTEMRRYVSTRIASLVKRNGY